MLVSFWHIMIHFQAKVICLQILFRISSFKLNHLHQVSKTSQPKLETKFSLRNKSSTFKMMNLELDVHKFLMINMGCVLLFAIFLSLAIPVSTFLFHNIFQMVRRRREKKILERKLEAKLVTVIVKKDKRIDFLHSYKQS